jgi:hypothetical protein
MTNLPPESVHRTLQALAELESEQIEPYRAQPFVFGSMHQTRAISIPLIEQADGTLIADASASSGWFALAEEEPPPAEPPRPKEEKPRREPPPSRPPRQRPGAYPGPSVFYEPKDISLGAYPGPSVFLALHSPAGKALGLKELRVESVSEAVQRAIENTLRGETS